MFTEEQSKCLEEWKSGKNVCVNAVCGSGKTRVLLSCASSFPEEKVLLLVYNRQLATELSSRVNVVSTFSTFPTTGVTVNYKFSGAAAVGTSVYFPPFWGEYCSSV